MTSPRALVIFASLLALSACRANEPELEASKTAAPASAPAPQDTGPRLEAPVAPDPERAAKLADLDLLCKAVDHDYKDGTLGDYYADLKMQSTWGQAQLDAGNESNKPARLLEKAVAELSPNAADPALEHCRLLLDYIDDVE